jgi:hypothetical protein
MEEVKAVDSPVDNSGDISIDNVVDKAFGRADQAEPAGKEAETKPETEDSTAPTDTTEEESDVNEPGKVKDPVRERLAKQRDAERQKYSELSGKYQELEAKLSQFQKVTNSPEFVRTQMKAEGYTDEAINRRLRDMGVDVPDVRPDVFGLIKSKMGIDPDTFTPEYRQGLSETEKVIDLILEDRLSRILPGQIAPLEKTLTEITRKAHSQDLLKSMRDTTAKEGILDFDKDIVPAIEKYIDANPRATQDDLKTEFIRLNHELALDRLKTKNKKDDRDVKKEVLKGKTVEGASIQPGKFAWQSGKHVGSNIDDLLNSFGIK